VIRPASDGIEIYLCVEPVDFRKQVNGLSMWVESVLRLDPLSSAVFAFTNRTLVKALFFPGGVNLWLLGYVSRRPVEGYRFPKRTVRFGSVH
jgi:transposase